MTTEKPRRRWFQFRLRTLLVFMTLCAIPFAWVASELAQRRRENAVIAWVEKMGGTVEFEDDQEASGWSEWTDQWFGKTVRVVRFDSTQVSDLSPLAGLNNLEGLNLNGTQVGDLSPLAGLNNLTSLRLDSTQVSKEQIEMLQKALPNCEITR